MIVVYELLVDKELIYNSYRSIAAKVNVSLSSVHHAVRDLVNGGFLVEFGKGRSVKRKLVNKDRLIQSWAENYAERLRPRIYRGCFTMSHLDDWKQLSLKTIEGCWGGETAAVILTGFIQPERKTIYLRNPQNLTKLIRYAGLSLDKEGGVDVLDAFWVSSGNVDDSIAHPLVVYADLIASNDQRNLEVADRIYRETLLPSIGTVRKA